MLSESHKGKDGKALAGDLKVEAPKPKQAAPIYLPQGPLKSKYHVQVGFVTFPSTYFAAQTPAYWK